MNKIVIAIFLAMKIVAVNCDDLDPYVQNVKFYVFNNITNESYISTFNESLTKFNCDPYGKFAFVIHGWTEGIYTEWVNDTVRNLTFYRGGCVIFMDYSVYSKRDYFFGLVPHFNQLARLLAERIRQATSLFENVFMFGFSFGARLSFEAGAKVGYNLIDHIQVCDPAGPGFDNEARSIDPKLSAKFVYCINTSTEYGSHYYNCHINFRMGICGRRQIGATVRPCRSHGLCPYFFNSAFENKFMPNNFYKCKSPRIAKNIPNDFRMGYMETRRSYLYDGDVFIPTAKTRPWNVLNDTILK